MRSTEQSEEGSLHPIRVRRYDDRTPASPYLYYSSVFEDLHRLPYDDTAYAEPLGQLVFRGQAHTGPKPFVNHVLNLLQYLVA